MGKRLYVGNLPYSANEQDLHDLFAGTGHEVYISDPSRVAPEKLKTIITKQMPRAPY